MALNDVVVKFRGDNKPLNDAMGKSKKGIAAWSKSVKGLIGAAVGIIAVRQLLKVGAAAVNMAREQAVAEAKLANVIRTTGGAAGFTSEQLQRYASNLQETIGIGDEVILNTQAIIATFTNIKGDKFKEVTALAFDMAAVLGTDAKQAAVQLGKAFNDPIKGMTALTRSGVSFTQSQKDQIKILQESGDLVGAQSVLVAELQKEFGGTAKAVDDANGSWNNAKNSIGDLMEVLGGELGPTIDKLAQGLKYVAEYWKDVATSARDAADAQLEAARVSGLEDIAKQIGGTVTDEARRGTFGSAGRPPRAPDLTGTLGFIGATGQGGISAEQYGALIAAGGSLGLAGLGGISQGTGRNNVGAFAGKFRTQDHVDAAFRNKPVNERGSFASGGSFDALAAAFTKAQEQVASKTAPTLTGGGFESLEGMNRRIASAAARSPEKQTADNTKEIVKHTKTTADQMSELVAGGLAGTF